KVYARPADGRSGAFAEFSAIKEDDVTGHSPQEAPSPPHLIHISTVIPRGEIARCDAAPRLPLPRATVKRSGASIDVRILPFVRFAARREGVHMQLMRPNEALTAP